MNRDELAAVQALTRSLGWKLLQREFGMQRDAIVESVMNPGTPLEEAQRRRQEQAGVDDVLGWPARVLAANHEEGLSTIMRAGVGPVSEENSHG